MIVLQVFKRSWFTGLSCNCPSPRRFYEEKKTNSQTILCKVICKWTSSTELFLSLWLLLKFVWYGFGRSSLWHHVIAFPFDSIFQVTWVRSLQNVFAFFFSLLLSLSFQSFLNFMHTAGWILNTLANLKHNNYTTAIEIRVACIWYASKL